MRKALFAKAFPSGWPHILSFACALAGGIILLFSDGKATELGRVTGQLEGAIFVCAGVIGYALGQVCLVLNKLLEKDQNASEKTS